MTILITGAPKRAASLADTLRAVHLDVTVVEDLEDLPKVVDALAPGSIDAYVQLPIKVRATGTSAVELVGDFLAQGIVARFESVRIVLPKLSDDAGVVLVSGNSPDGVRTLDDRQARLALLTLLSHAVRAERSTAGGWVRVVGRGGPRTDNELAQMVTSNGALPAPSVAVEADEELDYSQWKLALMTMDHGVA